MKRLKVPRYIAEAILGHVFKTKIEKVYDVEEEEGEDCLDERREALERWGAHLTAMRAGPNVIAMRSAARLQIVPGVYGLMAWLPRGTIVNSARSFSLAEANHLS